MNVGNMQEDETPHEPFRIPKPDAAKRLDEVIERAAEEVINNVVRRVSTASDRQMLDAMDEVAAIIDEDISALIEDAHAEARAILETHRATLDRLANALLLTILDRVSG